MGTLDYGHLLDRVLITTKGRAEEEFEAPPFHGSQLRGFCICALAPQFWLSTASCSCKSVCVVRLEAARLCWSPMHTATGCLLK